MLFSSDLRIFVVLSIFKFSSINCGHTWKENGEVSSLFATKGYGPCMLDTSIRIENFQGIGIYGIFSGHTENSASSFAAEFFPKKIKNGAKLMKSRQPSSLKPKYLNFTRILRDAIFEAENKKGAMKNAGTTCLLVIAEKKTLTVANLGDSRAVLCKECGDPIDLSRDYGDPIDKKPNLEGEPVQGAGSSTNRGSDGLLQTEGKAAVHFLGNHELKSYEDTVMAEPEISTFNLDKHRPEFLIIASKGIWAVMSSEDAVDLIEKFSDLRDFGASKLVEHAKMLGSNHDSTVIIVMFSSGRYKVASANA